MQKSSKPLPKTFTKADLQGLVYRDDLENIYPIIDVRRTLLTRKRYYQSEWAPMKSNPPIKTILETDERIFYGIQSRKVYEVLKIDKNLVYYRDASLKIPNTVSVKHFNSAWNDNVLIPLTSIPKDKIFLKIMLQEIIEEN